jgi:hypothetical protein
MRIYLLLAVAFVCSWYCIIFSHNTCTLYFIFVCRRGLRGLYFYFVVPRISCRSHFIFILFLHIVQIVGKVMILNTWKLYLLAVFFLPWNECKDKKDVMCLVCRWIVGKEWGERPSPKMYMPGGKSTLPTFILIFIREKYQNKRRHVRV